MPSHEPNRAAQSWQLVNDFQQLLGGDSEPDALFFVESWTLGLPAAVEGFKGRQQTLKDRECQYSALRDCDYRASLSFLLDTAENLNFVPMVHASTNAEGCEGAGFGHSLEELSAREQDPSAQQRDILAEEFDSRLDSSHPMTQQRALQLLGVAATSTPKQIKVAYKRLVSQWHPDRLERRTDEVRQHATEMTAAITEAYHLLRSTLP